jgi:putative redox protein
MSRRVVVDSGRARYRQEISVGPHRYQADEPLDSGGLDAGPDPYELLLIALGSCVGITLRMYADRKQWPLEAVRVELSWARVHMADCADCDNGFELTHGITMELSFVGDLSESQRERLMDIANKCPVHRTLSSPVQIQAREARD